MPYVLTVDQQESRLHADEVSRRLERLRDVSTLLPFVRTVGDEFQGVLLDPLSVARVILDLMRDGHWHIGVGIGPVEHPLPADSREARGPAFLAAREAVEQAKTSPHHVRVIAALDDAMGQEAAADVEVTLHLIGSLRDKRSDEGWEVIDLVSTGITQTEAARRIGISRQAVGQRLATSQWQLEDRAMPVVTRALARADLGAAAWTKEDER